MNFNNLKVAFSDKSNSDLNRAYLLFKSISNPNFSRILTSVLKICLWLKIPISPIIKATVFKHFCGGTNIKNSQKKIEFLWKSHIGTILDYSAEGKKSEKDFNHVMEETIQTIYKAKSETSIPFSVFKFTGLTHISLLEKLSLELPLSKMEENEKKNFVNRVENICKTAAENKVPIFIDAEESWIQEAIDQLTLEMMRKFNKKGCWIYNTIQMYRKDRLNYLDKIIQISTKEKFFLGLKIVRGAYHQKEIERSKEKEYPTPVHLNKADTDRDYNEALKICILPPSELQIIFKSLK